MAEAAKIEGSYYENGVDNLLYQTVPNIIVEGDEVDWTSLNATPDSGQELLTLKFKGTKKQQMVIAASRQHWMAVLNMMNKKTVAMREQAEAGLAVIEKKIEGMDDVMTEEGQKLLRKRESAMEAIVFYMARLES